jgi:hypothetical protein
MKYDRKTEKDRMPGTPCGTRRRRRYSSAILPRRSTLASFRDVAKVRATPR